MCLGCPICPLWTERDGTDRWDSTMGCPICPLELRDGMDIYSYIKGQTLTNMGHPLMSYPSVRGQ